MKKILALSALALISWQIGGVVPPAALTMGLGVVFGLFAGIPAMLIIAMSNKRVQHDHYHHAPTETPREPQVEPLKLSVKPTRYIVVANRPALPVGAQNKIEVSK